MQALIPGRMRTLTRQILSPSKFVFVRTDRCARSIHNIC